MTEKRYFEKMWKENYYIFDSEVISENDFDKKVINEISKNPSGDYDAFKEGLTGEEVVDLLNNLSEENIKLKKRNEILVDDIQEACLRYYKIHNAAEEAIEKGLSSEEEVFLKNLCKDMGLLMFCIEDEDKFCNHCRKCFVSLRRDSND